jgi:hypothetical protein
VKYRERKNRRDTITKTKTKYANDPVSPPMMMSSIRNLRRSGVENEHTKSTAVATISAIIEYFSERT